MRGLIIQKLGTILNKNNINTSSSASPEAMFVAHFVAAAFWHGWGQIFVAAASCATKVCNKSLRVSW